MGRRIEGRKKRRRRRKVRGEKENGREEESKKGKTKFQWQNTHQLELYRHTHLSIKHES